MHKSLNNSQISFFDFNESCGMQLDNNNEWVKLAEFIPWDRFESYYANPTPGKAGRKAVPLRTALGACIIQRRKKLSDRNLVKEIAENPYFQYFIGMKEFEHECPFKAKVLVNIRKRLTTEFIKRVNEEYLAKIEGIKDTEEPVDNEESVEAVRSTEQENIGTAILDATCSPSNIKYPQDYVLLNEARESLENMVDYMHKTYHPWKKPRTYRRVAREEYLALAKMRKKPEKLMRHTIRKELGYVNRNIGYVNDYMNAGYELPKKYKSTFETIKALYEQQKYMFDNHTHTVSNRIVSISQPFIRPIVRGKAKAPVEFGAKYDVCIDENGFGRLEKISFDPYNENTILKDVIERYRARTGHYPERILVDKIYRTRENRDYCKERGIRISGPRLGRPKKNEEKNKAEKAQEYKDNVDRIEVERFFSLEKGSNGGALITAKLEETVLHSIALAVFVTNLFMKKSIRKATERYFFVLFFSDGVLQSNEDQFIIIEEGA